MTSTQSRVSAFSELPLLIFGIPLFLSLSFKLFSLGSIGPIVFITGILQIFISPILCFRLIRFLLSKDISPALAGKMAAQGKTRKWIWIGILVVSILLGVVVGVLGMNFFIALTSLFGIMDYSLM